MPNANEGDWAISFLMSPLCGANEEVRPALAERGSTKLSLTCRIPEKWRARRTQKILATHRKASIWEDPAPEAELRIQMWINPKEDKLCLACFLCMVDIADISASNRCRISVQNCRILSQHYSVREDPEPVGS